MWIVGVGETRIDANDEMKVVVIVGHLRCHQLSDRDQIVAFKPPVIYHNSPDFGERQCKPRELKRAN